VLCLVVAACALAGCGGGGGGSGKPSTPAKAPKSAEQDAAEQIAFSNGALACSAYDVEDVAGFYGTSTNPEAIAKAVGKANGSTPAVQDAARRGCLSGLPKPKKKP
jgi:hypothetical protein